MQPPRRLHVFSRFSAIALVLAAAACHRSSGPSTAWAECEKLYGEAVRDRGLDVFADDRAARAQVLCEQVPADSSDAESAKALAARIKAGRDELAAEKQRLAKAFEIVPSTDNSPAPRAEAPPEAPPADALDGGTAPVGAPVVGSTAAEFRARYGACVRSATKFTEKGGTRQGEAFELDAANPACATQFPELAGKYVAVLDDKVFNVIEKTGAQRVERTETFDAGTKIVDAGMTPIGKPTIQEIEAGPYLPGTPIPAGEELK